MRGEVGALFAPRVPQMRVGAVPNKMSYPCASMGGGRRAAQWVAVS